MIYIIAIAIIVGLDQIIKVWAQNDLSQVSTLPVIDQVFHLTYARNTGAAFSIFTGKQLMLILVSVLILAFMGGLLVKAIQNNGPVLAKLAYVFIIGGAIGNLIDRVRLDYVIDYVDVRLINFAIFNLADCFVVVGAVLLVIAVLFKDYQL